jgi:glycosyltransferase involved in cell wall biosynthesis
MTPAAIPSAAGTWMAASVSVKVYGCGPVRRCRARKARATLVYEVHDLWPASPVGLGGMSPHHPFIVLCQKAENDAYRDADLVVSKLPNVAANMSAHGLDLRKLAIVPNGVTLEEWEGEGGPLPADMVAAIATSRAAGRALVAFAGSHGLPNALDVLLAAAALLRDEAIDFLFVGDGHEKGALVELARRERLANVHFLRPSIRRAFRPCCAP